LYYSTKLLTEAPIDIGFVINDTGDHEEEEEEEEDKI